MRLPHYNMVRPGDGSDLVGTLTGTMEGPVRKVELLFRTTSHAQADAMYDALLTLMREEGWTITLHE